MRSIRQHLNQLLKLNPTNLPPLVLIHALNDRIPMFRNVVQRLVGVREPVFDPLVFGRRELGFVEGDGGEGDKEEDGHDDAVELWVGRLGSG